MLRPSRCSHLIGILFVLAVFGNQAASAQDTSAEHREQVRLAAAVADTPSRLMAIGLSALAKLHISTIDLDVAWGGLRDDTLDRMAAKDVSLGLLNLQAVDATALASGSSLRAVMKYWPNNEASDSEISKDHPGYLLVAKEALPPDRVNDLVRAVLADDLVLQVSSIDLARLKPSTSMADLPLPLHQGVDDYLADQGIALLTGSAPLEPENDHARSFTLYFDTNDSRLERDDVVVVAEACKFAATLKRARFVISGHTDTVGTKAYNDWLSARRSANVAKAIRNDPRFRESLSVLDFGEQRLAISTSDGVSEAMNRRVEITIMPDS
jgi:outer membrane protein OmpA-like peptidoglycan-associated protein